MKKSFTLIEVLLYIAIIGVVITTLVSYAWNAYALGARTGNQQDLYMYSRMVSEQMLSAIRNANDINEGSSNFNVNFATNPSYQLSLVHNAPANPTVIHVVDGIATISYGSSGPVPLHPQSVRTTNLTFQNYSSTDDKTKHIVFTLTLALHNSGVSKTYQGSVTVESGAEVRSNSL